MSDAFLHTFGPWVQFFVTGGFTLLAGGLISLLAFHGERWLLQRDSKSLNLLGALPFPALSAALVYGGLRFSGRLLYPTDGWDTAIGAGFNYTNQNQGAAILYLCGFLLLGAALAAFRKNASQTSNN